MRTSSRRRRPHFFDFGPFRVDLTRGALMRDGEVVTLTSKAFDTLAVLLANSGEILDKDYLMKAVWPDTFVEENNLNQTISAVRKALGPGPEGKPYIETVPRRGYRFAVPVRSGEAADSVSSVQKPQQVSANGNHQGPPDLEVDADRADPQPAESRTTPLTPSLPSRLTGYRWLLRAGVALAVIGLGLAVTLAHRASPSRPAGLHTGIPTLAQGKFLAVLPFRVTGDEASLDYVAQGVAGELSARLFQLRGLHVASATAVERAAKKGPLERTARELGANLLVQGTLEGTAENVRLLITLDDAADGRRMWSGEFPGTLRDIVNLEDQIYLRVSAALGLEASNAGRDSVRATQNFEAYDLFLKGNDALRHRDNLKSVEAAVRFQQEALKKDPGFALAYAGLADASLEMYRQKKDRFWAERALESAQQAVRIDGNLAEAHFSLGGVFENTGRPAEAVAEERRGLELSPGSDEGYRHLAHALLDQGRNDEAIEAYQEAVRIDPYYWFNFNVLGYAYFKLGEFDEALGAFHQVIDIEPDNPYGYINVGSVYINQGKWSESIPFFEKALQFAPDPVAYSNMGTAYFRLRRYAEAVRMFEKAVEMCPNEQLVLGNLADAYRWSGQSQKASTTYNKAITLTYQELQVNPRDASAMQSLALYYAKKGDQDRALEFIQRARSLDSSNAQFMYSEAEVRSLAGQTSEAMDALRLALQKGYSPEEAGADPELAKLRSDPGFEHLIETAKHNKT